MEYIKDKIADNVRKELEELNREELIDIIVNFTVNQAIHCINYNKANIQRINEHIFNSQNSILNSINDTNKTIFKFNAQCCDINNKL